ncbi:interleukin-6-like [Ctenodactylus gundi]
MPNKPTLATSQQEKQISHILSIIRELKQEMCNGDVKCIDINVALLKNNLNLSKLTEKDGCFEAGYNWENCLLKLTSGLLNFEIYLNYMQNKFHTHEANNKAKEIFQVTKMLTQILKAEVKNKDEIVSPSPTAKAHLQEKLLRQNEGQTLLTIQVVMHTLQDFLQCGLRASRNHHSGN